MTGRRATKVDTTSYAAGPDKLTSKDIYMITSMSIITLSTLYLFAFSYEAVRSFVQLKPTAARILAQIYAYAGYNLGGLCWGCGGLILQSIGRERMIAVPLVFFLGTLALPSQYGRTITCIAAGILQGTQAALLLPSVSGLVLSGFKYSMGITFFWYFCGSWILVLVGCVVPLLSPTWQSTPVAAVMAVISSIGVYCFPKIASHRETPLEDTFEV